MFEQIKFKLNDNVNVIDSALLRYLDMHSGQSAILNESQKYSTIGGKKIRAFLTLELCRLLGGDIESAIPYACAIELIHASSLVHDDLPCMDNDDFRRGKPSTHKKFGETAALLTGDSLMIKAFEIVASNELLSADVNLNAIKILANSTGDSGMLGGQAIDTISLSNVKNLDDLINLHNLKTGKLISAAVKLGCLSACINTNDDRYIFAIEYAQNIGLAFQIVDDLLDYRQGRCENNSFLSFMTYDEAEEYTKDLTDKAVKAIRHIDDGTLEILAEYLTVREY